MKDTCNVIPKEALEVLRELKGKHVTGISVEHTLSLEHSLSQMVILHLADKDVSIWSEEVEPRPDEYPDLAQVGVYSDVKGHWDSLGDRVTHFPLDAVVEAVEVITDTVTIQEKNDHSFVLVNTKGIVIRFGTETLWLEKCCYWSEVWETTLIPNSDEYIFRNEWASVADDDAASYIAKTEQRVI